jgi:hypothetical protein
MSALLTVVALTAVCGLGGSASAQLAPAPEGDRAGGHTDAGYANFDARVGPDGTPVRGVLDALAKRGKAPEREGALARLRARVEFLAVDEDQILGTPGFVRSWKQMLTGENAGAAPAAVVRGFVKEYADLFEIDAGEIDAARVTRDFVTDHNGVRHLTLQQQIKGVDLFGALVKANVSREGRLVNISSTMLTRPAGDFAAAEGKLSDLEAIRAAAASVGVTMKTDPTPAEEPQGPSRKRTWNNSPDFRADQRIVTERVYFPMTRGEIRSAWWVLIPTRGVGHTYEIVVDANDGSTLHRFDELCFEATTMRVYPLRSPTPGPGRASNDGFRYPFASRSLVTIDSTTLGPASPFGWFDTNGAPGPEFTDTRGNNVDAHLDVISDNVPDVGGRADGGAGRLFDFPQDNGGDPAGATMAAVTQAFYWGNIFHDRLYALGFNEAAGNFQVNNYGRGGAGNDAVQLDCQDGGGTNNANFGTPADGSPPRCQMYLWTTATPRRDGDLDAEVIFHEFAHGLSNRLSTLNATQSGGMGEGWSDFVACCLLSVNGEDPNAPVDFGGYVLNNYYRGIRRYPYVTDLTRNPLTWDAYGASGTSAGGVTRSTEVHNTGEIWCMQLWECRAGLYEIYGYAANQMILQLVVDGMKLQPAGPTFAQARDAILQADLANNGGVNQQILWRAFAKRGLGFSFSTPGATSTATPTLGFDVPPYAENGDAGDLPATARTVLGSGSLAQIAGTLSADNADMYRIGICDFANFSATTVGGAGFNTQLFLFNSAGMPVEFNDDAAATTQSTLTNQFVAANGDYYLAISASNRDPVSSSGAIWLDTPTTTLRAPDGPGAASAVSGWTGAGDPGATPAYTITLTGACAASAGHVGLDPLPLTAFGSPAPGTVNSPGSGAVVFQVFVVAGTLPASTGITVNVNAAAIGLGTVGLLDNGASPDAAAGDRIFSAQRTTGTIAVGTYALPYTVTDGQGRTFNDTMQFVVVNPIGTCCLSGGVCTTQSALACFTGSGQFLGSAAGCNIRPCLGRTEVEPNDTTGAATDANANFLPYAGNLYHMGISGGISAGTDKDFFTIGSLQAGDVLTVSQAGSNAGAGTCTDTRVWLFRAGSGTAVANDDDGGPGTDSLLWRFPIAVADTYIVQGAGYATTSGGTTTNTGTYRLGLYLENAGSPPLTGGAVTAETEPNETTATANDASSSWRPVQYINTTAGSISAGDTDLFAYRFTAGDLVSTRVVSTSGLDAKSALLDPSGTSLILENSGSTGPGLDSPLFAYPIPATGTYYLRVQAGAGTGSYYAVVYLSTGTPPTLPCAPDFNNSGGLTVQDIFDFLGAWFAGDPRADFNNSGGLTVQDIFDFLGAWFGGC